MKRMAFSLLVAMGLTTGVCTLSPAEDWAPLQTEQSEAGWLDNASIWGGGGVYKSVGDRLTNINGGTGSLTSSYGSVFGLNTSFSIIEDSPIRGQIGASYGVYDFKGRLGIVPHSEQVEQQMFFTTGLYKRGEMRTDDDPISWAIAYDHFYADEWGINGNEIDLGQFRGLFGFALTEWTEVGVWGTVQATDDKAAVTVAGAPNVLRTIRAMNQANLYLKQGFSTGASVTGYVGVIDNAGIGDWQFGLLGQAPLSDNWSLYGNSGYVVPSATNGPTGSGEEQYNLSFGLAYSFGGKARSFGNRCLPLLDVANHGSFRVTD